MGLTFRQKLFISYLVVFLAFTTLLFPVITSLIEATQERNLKRRTKELIGQLEKAPSFDDLLSRLDEKAQFLFFRVSLVDPETGNVYDSHSEIEEGKFEEETLLGHPEVESALVRGSGYDVRFSPLFGQEMAYMAVAFKFQGKDYVLRSAFPYGQISDLSNDFIATFLVLTISILLLFGALTWGIIHILSRPIQQIVSAIKPYQLGEVEHLSEIKLGEKGAESEFTRLADTLNSLSKRIEMQINTLVQERNEKRDLLESLGEGVVAVDERMHVVYLNRMAEVFLGLTRKDLIGKSFTLTKQTQCRELIQEAHTQGSPLTTILKTDGPPRRYIDAIAVPRGTAGSILVLQDKTSLHKVIELGRDFIANASHELKTPITIIRGFAETLHDHPELSKEVSMEITAKIVTNCGRMDTLVKNLLTLAAVDEGLPRSRLMECDVLDLLGQARQTVLTVHTTPEIVLKTVGEEPFTLLADPDLLLQAFLNLLENGIKYSKPPAHITVTLSKFPAEFTLAFADEGIGIPESDLDRIFERFYAVDKSHSRSLGGSGLGLSIVERIVEKHKGKITVTSEEGVGTTFTLRLPVLSEDQL